VQLFARHWLNSLGTGAAYAFFIWVPWIVMTQLDGLVSINRFAPDAAGRVMLDGSWSLLEGGSGKLLMSRPVRFESAAGAPDASSQASAMSALLGQLAQQIAGSLRNAI